jgi:hypothetical protein
LALRIEPRGREKGELPAFLYHSTAEAVALRVSPSDVLLIGFEQVPQRVCGYSVESGVGNSH